MVTISTAGDSEDTPLGKLRAKAYELPGMVREGARRYVRSADFSFTEYALDEDADVHDLDLVKTAEPGAVDHRRGAAPPARLPLDDGVELAPVRLRPVGGRRVLRVQQPRMGGVRGGRSRRPRRPRAARTSASTSASNRTRPRSFPSGSSGAAGGRRSSPPGVLRGRRVSKREWVRDEAEQTAYVGKPTILTPPGDGTSLSVDVIFAACRDLAEQSPEATFVIDPLAGGEHLAQRLDAELDQARIVTYSQGNNPMSRASQGLAEMIASRRLKHPDDAGLNAHVLACGVRQIGEGWRLAKQPGSKAPIDAAVALAMALAAGLAEGATAEPPKTAAGRLQGRRLH